MAQLKNTIVNGTLDVGGIFTAPTAKVKFYSGEEGGHSTVFVKDALVTTNDYIVGSTTEKLTSSSSDAEWLKRLLVKLCETYPNTAGVIFKGKITPNSVGYYKIYIYNTSAVDSTTKLPQHSFGEFRKHSLNHQIFGTSSYSFSCHQILYNTGSWGISITGSAAKLGTSNVGAADRPIYLNGGTASQTTYRMAATNAVATTSRAITDNLETGIWYVNGTNSTDLYSQSDGAAYVNKYSDSWISEIYQDYRTGQIALRGKNNGTWQAWRKVLDSSNYTDWTVTKTGTGASGTWEISITGNATTTSLIKPIATTTTASASTWNIPTGSKQIWGEKFSDSTLTYTPSGGSATTITDTGDWVIWLTPNATSNAATLNMRIDGTYYGSFSGNLSGTATNATTATKANYLQLYEARGTTTTLNKTANYVAAGALFHLIASSSTSATDNGKPPMGDANVLQMNWDNNGGYDAQLAISTQANRMEFRDQISTKKAWREVVTSTPGTAEGSSTQPVYISTTGVATACTALKDLAYIDKPSSNQTTTFLRGDGTWQAANNYSLPLAANGTRGGVQIGYTASGKNYPVQLSSEKMYVNVPWTDTTYSNFVKSGSTAAAGLVPSPGTTAGVERYLNEDGTWKNVYESFLSWGGKNFSASYGPIDAAMIDPLGANRFAFLKAAGLTIEYSTDGGSNWADYGATNAQKVGLFSNGCSFYLGKHTSSGSSTVNDQLRVTIDTGAAQIYTTLNKIVIYMSTQGNTTQVKIEKALQSTPTTYSTHLDWTGIAGWSGWNILNISNLTTYGNTASSQYGRIRFTFKQSAVGSNTAAIITRIMGFGGMGWTVPSNMARDGHLYSYDADQNATFPAKVTATNFTGPLTGNANTATKLATARNLKVALDSTTDVTFDGSANQTSIPISGTLAIAHGGTGATTAADARTNLGLGSIATETATNYLKWQTTTAASTALYDFGVYVNQNNAAGTGMAGSNYFQIINIPYRKASGNTKADWGFQIGNRTSNDGRLWYRTSGDNVWGDWQTIAHATQSTTNTGSATQPVYMTAAGTITPCTYTLGANVNYTVNASTAAGTANQLAYYSGANAISGAGGLRYYTGQSTASTPATYQRLHISGATYGNTAAELVSGVAGVLSWGDGGPQITFDTNSTPGGGQAGALIFTDHDTVATGASFSFVSNQGDWNVISKRFHATTGLTVGGQKPPANFAVNNGSSDPVAFTMGVAGNLFVRDSIQTNAQFISWRNATGNGFSLAENGSTYIGLNLNVIGTTSATGCGYIYAGNTYGSGTAHNAYGIVRTFGTTANYYTQLTAGALTANLSLSGTADRFTMPKLQILMETDIGGTTSSSPPFSVGPLTGTHIEMDGNEIIAKSNATTPANLFLQDATGGAVYCNGTGGFYVQNGLLRVVNNSKTVTIGAQNTGFIHIYQGTSGEIPFIFNGTVATTTGDLGTSTYKFGNGYFSGCIYGRHVLNTSAPSSPVIGEMWVS